MRIAIEPHIHRHLSWDWMELAPRGDFLEWFEAPRVFPERVRAFKRALEDADVEIASLLPMYRWASNDEVERLSAVRHWKRAIEICVELGVDTMKSEFGRGPHPDKGSCYCCHTGSMIEACEDAWWRSCPSSSAKGSTSTSSRIPRTGARRSSPRLANLYLWIAQAIDAKRRGDEAFLKDHHHPGIAAGTKGVRWLENCVRSADAGSTWVDFK